MSQASLSRCLQLFACAVIVSTLQGKVIAPSRKTGRVDSPVTLDCEVTLQRGEEVKQVLWLDSYNETLVAYQPEAKVTMDTERVSLSSDTRNSSGITLLKVQEEDTGCYVCVFYVYPIGKQEGHICLSLTAEVDMETNMTGVSGKAVTLSCQYGLPQKVEQVVWQKTEEQGDTRRLAYYTKDGQTSVDEPYRGRLTLKSSPRESQLLISPVSVEDEGCYSCDFYVYPEGIKSARSCLTVYVFPKVQVNYQTISTGIIEANCTARARPAARIKWNVEGNNRTLGPAESLVFEQGDGTSTVISTLLLQADLLKEQSVQCLVYHHGLDSPISTSLNSKIGKALTILISVTTVAALLILCLCVCLWKCFLRKDY